MQLAFKTGVGTQRKDSSPPFYDSRFRTQISYSTVLWIIIGLGILVRLYHFFHNRSLWNDEVFLVNSLIRMDFLELVTQPLMYEQKAPIGFLWVTRLSVLLFGENEMALRLFSLVSGIAALFIFLPVSRYFLKSHGRMVAMAILAFSSPIIYHSVEAKQYSVELLATVTLLYLYILYHKKESFFSLLQWGFFGATILWFSYSSIFMLAGTAFGVCISLLVKKDWKLLFRSLLPFSIWLLSFGINYFIFTHRHAGSEWLLEWFKVRGGFMPLPPTSVSDFGWFFHSLYMTLRYSIGLLWINFTHEDQWIQLLLRMPFLPIIFGVAGFAVMFRKSPKNFMVLLIPILLTLLASGLELYPFYERLIVFLAPIFILFIALGCQIIVGALPERAKWKYILPALLLAGPIMNSGVEAVTLTHLGDHYVSQQREGFLYVNERFKEGDVVYVFWNNYHYYQCFKEMFPLKYNAIEGKDVRFSSATPQEYYQKTGPDKKDLVGKKRIWVIYNKYFKYPLGELEGQPLWYEKEIPDPGKEFYRKVAESTIELDVLENGEYKIGLFQLSGTE